MKNAILPQLSSHLYRFGYNEALTNVIPSQTDSNLTLCDLNFCNHLDSQNQHSWSSHPILIMFSQPPVDYISEFALTMPKERIECADLHVEEQYYSTSTTICDSNFIYPPPVPLCKTLSVQQSENELLQTTKSTRKRSIEASDHKKHKKAMCFQQVIQYPQVEGDIIQQQKRVTTRRSQKLTDKITALQKLVSPYGKTDTASVLVEACVSIKFLQDQIQNLLHMLSTSSNPDNGTVKSKGGGVDLQSKGLCLAPLVFTKKIIEGGCDVY